MTEKKSRERVRPLVIEEEGGTGTRDSFFTTLFRRGAELAHELEDETTKLRARVAALESANDALRAQLGSDAALRDALRRIDQLERERDELASVSTRTVAQCSAVENDLANMANLYIAADQLHSTLDLARVLRHISELLEQFVGSREHALYYVEGETLAPLATHGIEKSTLPVLSTRPVAEGPPLAARVVEQTFLTGTPFFEPDVFACGVERPAACVPLQLDGRIVGVIAVYRLLDQKQAFTANDRELFRMLGAHAATAITGALLWQRARSEASSP
jgi:transcriptional regulator with GAF, ATPase, and Fis domain